jgi:hypothetical protein
MVSVTEDEICVHRRDIVLLMKRSITVGDVVSGDDLLLGFALEVAAIPA